MDYDLLVIGNDRAGFERAIEVAHEGGRVAIIASSVAAPTMSLLQSAADNVAGRGTVSLPAWKDEVTRLYRCQLAVAQAELDCLGIECLTGSVKFLTSTSVEVSTDDSICTLTSRQIVVACGTRPRQSRTCAVDAQLVMNADSLLGLVDLPRSTIVVGAGPTGLAAAVLLATLGVEVTIVDEHGSIFDICTAFDGTFAAAQSLNIAFRLGDEVIGTERRPDLQAAVRLASGRAYVADVVIVCIGREGDTLGLDLEQAGVGLDEHGRVWCNADGTTWAATITAVGSVIGFPRTNAVVAALSI